MKSANQKRPVQLQVNTAGAWKTVLKFDAGDDTATTQVQHAVALLHEQDTSTKWRITTIDRHPIVLRAVSASTYGIWMDNKEAA